MTSSKSPTTTLETSPSPVSGSTVSVGEGVESSFVSVEAFIGKAIEMNVPVETLERLFALRKEAKAEQAQEAYTVALSKFQAECPIIAKNKDVLNKDNKTVRYSYASLDSIVSQVKEILGRNGLSYTISTLNEEGFITVTCKITQALGHSETSSFKVPIDLEGYMSTPQKYASALTFAKRYAFCNALGILTGDDDADATDLKQDKLATYVKEAQKKLESVTTLDELKAVWAGLNAEAKKELESLKEELKTKLTV